MKAFRLFTAAARAAAGPTKTNSQRCHIHRPQFQRYMHATSFSARTGRAGTSWQARFQEARSRQQQEQTRGYRQQTFRTSRFATTRNLFQRWAARPTFYYEVAGIAGTCGAWYVYHLETVPVSGRTRFNCVSEDFIKRQGLQMFEQLIRQYHGSILPETSREHRMAVRVMQRLIPHCGLEGEDWDVKVIKDDSQQNAFVLPGGKVFIFSGILGICKNEEGLAAVLGHEIAHNVAHHSAERASRSAILLPIGLLLFLATGIDPSITRIFGSFAFELPGSRQQETEADYLGLLMMAMACYDPKAALRLWAEMERVGQGREPPQMLSTHPHHHTRLEKIQGWLEEAYQKRDMSDCATTGWNMGRFQEVVQVPEMRW